MMNNKIDELIKRVGTDVSGKWISVDKAEELVKIAIAECYIAIDNTNTHHVYTTFDQDMVGSTIKKSKQAIKEHFGV